LRRCSSWQVGLRRIETGGEVGVLAFVSSAQRGSEYLTMNIVHISYDPVL
jgi:hypothetical protein